MSDLSQPHSGNAIRPTRSKSKPEALRRVTGPRTQDHSASANANTATLHSQGGPLTRRRTTAARPYNSIQQDAGNLTGNTKLFECTGQSRNDDSQAPMPIPPSLPILPLAEDLTGQIFGTINDYVAGGALGNVYRCEWRRPSGTVKVAVKSFRYHTSEQDLRRIRREAGLWAHFVNDNIVPLYGMTEGFGETPALVSQWFPDGTLLRLITEQGATLTIRSKLKLLHDIASGLYYLHSFPVVHGDITSSNVLVDIQGGEYKACLTDFGVSNVLGGPLKDCVIEGSTVRPGAIRWTAPELLRPHDHPSDVKPTTQNDMYSYGRVMFHLLTLIIPWYDIDEYKVVQKILSGEDIPRPEISAGTRSDITDARWNQIKQCWSVDPSARPSAFMAMDFLKCELEAATDDDVFVGGVRESHHSPSLDVVDTQQITAPVPLSREAEIINAWPHQSSSGISTASQSQAAPFNLTIHQASTASTLSLSGPSNVLLFGETGVGKSAIINLIMRQEVAQTSPDAEPCTLKHTAYEISLGMRRFKLWEVSSIESMGFFRALFSKWRLKKAFKKLYRDDGVYLLLYCMRGSRAQRGMIRDYKIFTDIISSAAGTHDVRVAAVVTCLEDYPMNMDHWWTMNKDNLESLGMRFSAHACITSLPDDPNASQAMRARRNVSEKVIRTLIDESYQAGRTPVNSYIAPTL